MFTETYSKICNGQCAWEEIILNLNQNINQIRCPGRKINYGSQQYQLHVGGWCRMVIVFLFPTRSLAVQTLTCCPFLVFALPLQGSQLSWNCPKISNCPEILLIWSECPDMDLCYAVATLFFTSLDYVYVADVEFQVMFSLVTLYCFMFNIALVTFLGLQYWSASMINFLWAQTNVHFLSWASWNRQKCPEIF